MAGLSFDAVHGALDAQLDRQSGRIAHGATMALSSRGDALPSAPAVLDPNRCSAQLADHSTYSVCAARCAAGPGGCARAGAGVAG